MKVRHQKSEVKIYLSNSSKKNDESYHLMIIVKKNWKIIKNY